MRKAHFIPCKSALTPLTGIFNSPMPVSIELGPAVEPIAASRNARRLGCGHFAN
jgi:hypothetical protein